MTLNELIKRITDISEQGHGGDDVRLIFRDDSPFGCFNPEIKDIYTITNDSQKGVSVVYIEVG